MYKGYLTYIAGGKLYNESLEDVDIASSAARKGVLVITHGKGHVYVISIKSLVSFVVYKKD